MAHSFRVEASHGGASLTLLEHDRDYFLAQLNRHPGLQAETRVDRFMFSGFADFFGDLAENWKGWKGTRKWASLEGELKLEAESDRTGHIELTVVLDEGVRPLWRTQLTLTLESGQLESIVAEAREFERSALSAI